jgi:hypothetical protein
LGDFPRLSREKALELVFKTEAKNKGWDTFEKSKDEPQPRSAGDNFVEQQQILVEVHLWTSQKYPILCSLLPF